MTGPLSEFVAAQHVKDLLDEAARDRKHRGPSEDDPWSRPTPHPLRRGRIESRRRKFEVADTVATRSESAAIDCDRPALAKAR
jgi:hypothetical protein